MRNRRLPNANKLVHKCGEPPFHKRFWHGRCRLTNLGPAKLHVEMNHPSECRACSKRRQKMAVPNAVWKRPKQVGLERGTYDIYVAALNFSIMRACICREDSGLQKQWK